jgi:hypothetical protein
MSHTNPYYAKYSKKQYCPVRCSTDVELDLDVKPRVSCREISRKGTEFDIELDFKVDHHCKLIPKKTYKDECGCVTKCVFGVQLDFDCVPKVLHHPCQKPTAEYELDVELDVSPHCKPIEGCKVRYYKAQEEQKESSDEESEEKPKEKKKDKKKHEKKKCESSSSSSSDSTPCTTPSSTPSTTPCTTQSSDDSKCDSSKFFDTEDFKSSDKSDVECDCEICKPKHKKEERKEKKKSYWL